MSYHPHILVVEDDPSIAEHITETLKAIDPEIVITLNYNRDEALASLSSTAFFDLLSLDLTIPASKNSSDTNIVYGHEILQQCKYLAPGLATIILTASSADDLVSDILDSTDKADIWGEGQRRSTVGHVTKRRLEEYGLKVKSIVEAINSLRDVEVNRLPDNLDISLRDDRLIRIFCKRKNSVRCRISRITNGLSGARVYKIALYNSSGNLFQNAIAKMANHDDIRIEQENYNTYIIRLHNSTTPRCLEANSFGAKDTAAIFYSVVDDYDTDLFGAIEGNKANTDLFNNIRNIFVPWINAGAEKSVTIGCIRRLLVSDEVTNGLISTYSLDWTKHFETITVQAKWCCIHGDLHGQNVLIKEENHTATLIDYGDVKEGPLALDPITMEFSIIFHKDGPAIGSWPSVKQAENWYDLNIYLVGCPFPDTIAFYRAWLIDGAASKREISGAAYAYFLRQLKYPDTDKQLAVAFLEGCRNYMHLT